MQAIPLVVNRVLNKAGLAGEVGSQSRHWGLQVIAYGPRSQAGEGANLLTEAEKALKAAGYDVEWAIHEGVNNTYLIVRDGTPEGR